MPQRQLIISNTEKVISLLSYFTMGIAGVIWILIAYFLNRRLKIFLMYNIVQSMIISIFLFLLSHIINLVVQFFVSIPLFNKLGIALNMFFQNRFNMLFLSFNKIEIIVFLVLIYLTVGILNNRLFYLPLFTKVTKRIMRNYK